MQKLCLKEIRLTYVALALPSHMHRHVQRNLWRRTESLGLTAIGNKSVDYLGSECAMEVAIFMMACES